MPRHEPLDAQAKRQYCFYPTCNTVHCLYSLLPPLPVAMVCETPAATPEMCFKVLQSGVPLILLQGCVEA